ncbi:zinc alcohol dehydrogenase [Xylariaceae sp. FL1272]|nr:zinc alcohol dehydrogenase [Xylariaceae sp. FL1272]
MADAEIPETMRAWVAARPGKPQDVLQLMTDRPTPPPPEAGEILVQVLYVALNPGDVKLMAMSIPLKRDFIPMMDFAGKVVRIGPPSAPPSSTEIGVGHVVAGTLPASHMWHGTGALAEYVIVPSHMVAIKPDRLPEPVAAGLLGVVGQTTAALLRAANLLPGDRALVNGGSGGVGSILVQALHGMGVHVTATCSARNTALVSRLGVDEVVDYAAHESLYDYLTSSSTAKKPFDCIFDCVGDDTLYWRSPGYLKEHGTFISIERGPFGIFAQTLFNHWPRLLGGIPRKYVNVFSRPSGSSAQQVVELFEKGWIREVPVDSMFEMADALKAFEKLATGRAAGKIFIKIN